MKKYKILIFDFGDVIGSNPASQIFKSISKKFGIKYSLIKKVVSELAPKVQKNKLSEKIFWRELGKRLKIKNTYELKRTWMKVYEENIKLNQDMISLLKKLKKRYKLCLLSNTTKFHKKASFRKKLEKLFDIIVYSCDVGIRKPEKEIYLLLLKKIKEDPQNCIIIDDKIENLKYPKKLGMRTIHFKSSNQLKRQLKKIGIDFR